MGAGTFPVSARYMYASEGSGVDVQSAYLMLKCFLALLCMPNYPLAETWVHCYISNLMCSDSPSFIKFNEEQLFPYLFVYL